MAYSRIKFFWGALDIVHSDESAYTTAQTKSLGENVSPPGIGVRRAQLVFTRAGIGSGEDSIVGHFDFLNLTSGNPDDTWTTGDFTTLETAIGTFFTSTAGMMWSKIVFDQIRWYRIGPGTAPPNPPVRITDVTTPGSGANPLPPQVALSVTFKTAVRKGWGRIYLPYATSGHVDSNGYVDASTCSNVANATKTLFDTAQAAEFTPVVYSPTRGKAFSIETIQVDNLYDVIRSRRYDKATLKEVRP